MKASTHDAESDTLEATGPAAHDPSHDFPGTGVWRYDEVCRYWKVSRTTIERWVKRFEENGEGIPVRRDPSGRPYWLPEEAAASTAVASAASRPTSSLPASEEERLSRLRLAARRNRRVA